MIGGVRARAASNVGGEQRCQIYIAPISTSPQAPVICYCSIDSLVSGGVGGGLEIARGKKR